LRNFFPPSRSFPFAENRLSHCSRESALFLFLRDHGDLIPPRSECGEDDAGADEDVAAAADDTTATALPAAAAEEDDDDEDEDAAATRSDRMWIHDEDGGEDAAVGEDDDDGEDEVLDRRSAFMSLSPTYPASPEPHAHPTSARH